MDDIEKLLSELGDTEQEEVSMKDLEPVKKREVDITDNDEVAKKLFDMVSNDRGRADEIFDLFYANLAADKDRSQASKEALTKALELKIEASKNIIELMKVQNKANESGNKLGIFFDGVPSKKTNIDMDIVREVAENED
jgi:hypothetical protein